MTTATQALDIARIRQDFPRLNAPFHGKPVIYLDSAVSSLTPKPVVDRLTLYQTLEHTNVHRGVSTLSQEATDRFEEAREKVRAFINAPTAAQVIWTRGTTESVNLVAQTFGRAQVKAGDEILLSAMEHHSNIVPWQLLAEEKGAKIKVIPMTDAGELILDDLESLLTERTRILGVTHVSNVLGTINPIKEIIARAHARNVPVLVDGAQGAPHLKVDVTDLDADFYVFSGHRDRRALRAPGAAGGHAALARRRQHDPVGHLGKDHLLRPAHQVRGRHPRHRPGHRPGSGHRLPPGPGPGAHRRPRARPAGLRQRALRRHPGPAHHRPGQAQGQRPVLRPGGHPPP
jgi:selenocysteine lyase/cysteine desulfurase